MNASRTRRIGRRLVAALSSQAWVLAIFNNGSTVAGTDQRESDVDFTVIVRRAADRGRALRLLRRRFPYRYHGLDHGVPSFSDRRTIGVTIIERATVERWLRRLYRTPTDFLELEGIVQHKIAEAVAVFDPGSLLDRYQTKVAAFPRRIQRAVVSRALEALDAAYASWGFRNEFQYAAQLPSLLENISIALYARNRRLFMVPFKRLHADLAELKPNIEAEMHRLVRGGRSVESRADGKRALRDIIQELRAA